MRILLTEGSGLTSRQVATRLGALGHRVEVLSSTALCLARFTRHVRNIHPVPNFGREPLAWLDAAIDICRQSAIDVLFPTQEQVAILSALQDKIPVRTIVPDFASLLSSTLPNLSGVAERFGESLPECGRNFHAIRVEPGH